MTDGRRIDEALRSVPVPPGLSDKVRPAELFADAGLDQMLSAVVVPIDLAARIRAAVHTAAPTRRNGALDLTRFAGRLDGEAFPGTGRLIPAARPSRGRRLSRLAGDMTSVAAALGLVLLLAAGGLEFSRRLENLAAAPPRSSGSAPGARPRVEVGSADRGSSARGGMAARAGGQPGIEVVRPEVSPEPAGDTTAPQPPAALAAAIRGEAGQLEEPVGGDLSPAANSAGVRGAAMGLESTTGRLAPPTMTTIEIPTAVRRGVPRVRGYDLAFEMTTGEHPFVDPAADPALAVARPPLTLRTDGYEALVAIERPDRTRIRAEEVLAAVPPAVAPGPDGPPVKLVIHELRGLRTSRGAPTVLVEVAATAGPSRREPAAEPLDVTLVLDQAAGGQPAVWRRVCRALGDLAAQLQPADRVSVVVCGTRPRIALQSAGSDRLAAFARDLEWQAAAEASDLDAGLALAAPSGRVIVIAHANSLETARGGIREALAAWHSSLSSVAGDTLACTPRGGTRFIVIDPAAPSPLARGEPGFGRTSPDAVSIRRALIEQATGRSTLVGSRCELEVAFDPRRVARYRLIGHRQSAIESLADAPHRAIDLHAGETVRVVYEVLPRAPGGGLGSAVFRWRMPDGEPVRLEVGPGESTHELEAFPPSPHGCEVLLAAGLGELAAGSAHVDRRPALANALEQLVAAWRARGDVTPFGDTLAGSLDRHGGRGGW